MSKIKTFNDVLEAADKLSTEEREIIIDILRKRMIEQRRKDLLKDVKIAQTEFAQDRCHPASPGDMIKEIMS